jgi:hypothetical protein
MSEMTHTSASAGTDTQWRQGGVIGAAVGTGISIALSVGLAPTRFPDGGSSLLTTGLLGVVIGLAVGATLGMIIGRCVPIDPATRDG